MKLQAATLLVALLAVVFTPASAGSSFRTVGKGSADAFKDLGATEGGYGGPKPFKLPERPLLVVSEKDYKKPNQIVQAVQFGFGFLEVDVRQYLGKPYLCETFTEYLKAPPLEEGYIQPIVDLVEEFDGEFLFKDKSELTLIIDFKSDNVGAGTIRNVNSILSQHPQIFSRWEGGKYHKRPVRVIAAGNRWIDWMVSNILEGAEEPDGTREGGAWYVGIQGHFFDWWSPINEARMKATQLGLTLTNEQLLQISPMVGMLWDDEAHDPARDDMEWLLGQSSVFQGQLLRIEGLEGPQNPPDLSVWDVLHDAGQGRVLINTEAIEKANEFMIQKAKDKAEKERQEREDEEAKKKGKVVPSRKPKPTHRPRKPQGHKNHTSPSPDPVEPRVTTPLPTTAAPPTQAPTTPAPTTPAPTTPAPTTPAPPTVPPTTPSPAPPVPEVTTPAPTTPAGGAEEDTTPAGTTAAAGGGGGDEPKTEAVDDGKDDGPDGKKKDDADEQGGGGVKPNPKPDEDKDKKEPKNVPLWLFLTSLGVALGLLLLCGLGCLSGALKVHTHSQTGEHYLFVFGRQFCTFGGRA